MLSLKVGEWFGKVAFLVVTLMILMSYLAICFFFALAKAIPMPFFGGLLIMDEKQPCFVRAIKKELPTRDSSKKNGVHSAM